MTTKLERIRKAARDRFTPEQREPWEFAWARVFEALPDFCEDTDALRIEMLQAAMAGQLPDVVAADMIARETAVPPCPIPPPCPV